eukprot:scaffold254_cov379-Pavlova_lutheri.AAC.1
MLALEDGVIHRVALESQFLLQCVCEVLIPHSGGLLQSIEGLLQFKYQVRFLVKLSVVPQSLRDLE